jgi:hypothetical protein
MFFFLSNLDECSYDKSRITEVAIAALFINTWLTDNKKE